MKYPSTIYAKALAELILDKKNALDFKKITKGLFSLMQKNGDVSKAKEIFALAESMLLKKSGHKKITLEIARNANIKNMMKVFSKAGDSIEEKINPKIIAGVKISIDGVKQLDLSLQKKLGEIFK